MEELITCPSCGAQTPAALGVCIECFSTVDRAAEDAAQEAAQAEAAQADLSPAGPEASPSGVPSIQLCCGQPLSGDAQRCPYCDEPRPSEQPPQSRPSRHTLVFPRGLAVEVDPREPLQIGRDVGIGPGAALDYPNNVSRRHAEVASTPAGLRVTDLASANGTFLNGSRLQPNVPAFASPGDRIRFAASFEAVVADGGQQS